MLHASVLALASLFLLLALFTLPSLSVAQPPPPPPGFTAPDDAFHGWSATDIAASLDPSKPNLYYIIDGTNGLVQLDVSAGWPKPLQARYYVDGETLSNIAVDSRGYVYCSSYNYWSGAVEIKVHDATLRPIKNITLSQAKPATGARDLQLVVDSTNYLYAFDGIGYSRFGVPSNTLGRVWEFEPRQWVQTKSWVAPIPRLGNTSFVEYIIAIDNQDYLYFQEDWGYKALVITDDDGVVQQTFQLGQGPAANDPFIVDVAIDAQLNMWHTHFQDTTVSVVDSNGRPVAVYDVLSAANDEYASIAVDSRNQPVVVDTVEQQLLQLSARGDIVNTIGSQVAPTKYVSELLADYARQGEDSLLFDDSNSPYPVRRMSLSQGNEGSLLQRYTLPSRLADNCDSQGLDVGLFTSNIYVLLRCGYYPQEQYGLVYVMAQSGRVVSEFRVDSSAYRVRSDEQAGALYVAAQYYPSRGQQFSAVLAYSTIDGTLQNNYTTAAPQMAYVSDLVVLPGPGPNAPSTIVVVDYGNSRFVNIDTSKPAAPAASAFPNNTYVWDIAYSFAKQGAAFYASGYGYYQTPNGTYQYDTYIVKVDISDPRNPHVSDTFIGFPGLEANFGPMTTSRDGHLYAYDFLTQTVYRWRNADRATAEPAVAAGEPRVHVADAAPVKAAAPASVARWAEPNQRHRRMRGARSN